MKKLLFFLMAAMFLVACGNDEPEVKAEPEDSEDAIVTLAENEYEIELFENEDMKMTLKKLEHLKVDYMELLTFYAEVENKTDGELQLVLVDLTVDGVEYGLDSTLIDNEVSPGMTTDFEFGVFSEEEIKFNEHIKGNIKYMDYENNVKDIEFSEYINE